VLYFVVKTRQSNPLIVKLSRPCNEFTRQCPHALCVTWLCWHPIWVVIHGVLLYNYVGYTNTF